MDCLVDAVSHAVGEFPGFGGRGGEPAEWAVPDVDFIPELGELLLVVLVYSALGLLVAEWVSGLLVFWMYSGVFFG